MVVLDQDVQEVAELGAEKVRPMRNLTDFSRWPCVSRTRRTSLSFGHVGLLLPRDTL